MLLILGDSAMLGMTNAQDRLVLQEGQSLELVEQMAEEDGER